MTQANDNTNQNASAPTKKEGQLVMAEREGIFCPSDLSGQSADNSNGKETEKNNNGAEQKMQEILENMAVETSHLNEVMSEESKIINEVCLSLKEVLKKLHVSFNIPPQDISPQRRTRRVILNEEGNLVFVYENGQRHSAFLAEYPPEMVMSVLWVVIPELGKAITTYRKKMNARASFFEKVKKELKVAAKTITGNDKTQAINGPSTQTVEKETPKAKS